MLEVMKGKGLESRALRLKVVCLQFVGNGPCTGKVSLACGLGFPRVYRLEFTAFGLEVEQPMALTLRSGNEG